MEKVSDDDIEVDTVDGSDDEWESDREDEDLTPVIDWDIVSADIPNRNSKDCEKQWKFLVDNNATERNPSIIRYGKIDDYHFIVRNFIQYGQPVYHPLSNSQKELKRMMKKMAYATHIDSSGRSVTDNGDINDTTSVMMIPGLAPTSWKRISERSMYNEFVEKRGSKYVSVLASVERQPVEVTPPTISGIVCAAGRLKKRRFLVSWEEKGRRNSWVSAEYLKSVAAEGGISFVRGKWEWKQNPDVRFTERHPVSTITRKRFYSKKDYSFHEAPHGEGLVYVPGGTADLNCRKKFREGDFGSLRGSNKNRCWSSVNILRKGNSE